MLCCTNQKMKELSGIDLRMPWSLATAGSIIHWKGGAIAGLAGMAAVGAFARPGLFVFDCEEVSLIATFLPVCGA